MIINLEALNKALYLESCGKDDTLYISLEDLNKALKIAIANTNIEKEIDNKLCKIKEETAIKNDEIKKDFREAMFECIQYFREAGHLKDLDNSYK